jgi:hypothetical protein
MIPTENEIEKLKNRIKIRKERYKELIQLLDEWEIKIYNKIEELKRNLMYEIELMEKMFSSFNKCFFDYTYFKNFEYFKDYMRYTYSTKFDKCYTFEDLKDILEELFEKEDISEKPKLKDMNLICGYSLKDGLITRLNDEFLFCYSYNIDKVKIVSIDRLSIREYDKTTIDFRQRIFSASLSLQKNKIYATLTNSRKVVIFNLDLENQLMERSDDEIKDNEDGGRFNKCIEISDEFIATADTYSIIIWKKYTKEYVNIKKIYLDKETYDLLLINNEYFVSTQANQKTLTFIDIPDLKEDKIITEIDCIEENNCLFLFKNNIIVNCKEGIAIILLETKEIIQYIENFDSDQISKRLSIYNNDNDYILYILNRLDSDYNKQKFNVKIMKLEDDQLKLIGRYDETEIEDQGKLQIIALNKYTTLIYGNKIYIQKNEL